MSPTDTTPPLFSEQVIPPGMPYDILRLPVVLRARGRSRAMHYRDIKAGLFTPPIALGGRAVGWPSYELVAINEARIAGKRVEDIRALVSELIASRNSSAKVG